MGKPCKCSCTKLITSLGGRILTNQFTRTHVVQIPSTRQFCLSQQNIIKKVSGQKFVYKFVTFPDPNSADGLRSPEETQRLIGGEKTEACVQSKAAGGAGATVACLSKSLQQPQRSSPSSVQRSSRNDYMKSGLYSTFTIQSLQTPCKSSSKVVKMELPVENTPKLGSTEQPLQEVGQTSLSKASYRNALRTQ